MKLTAGTPFNRYIKSKSKVVYCLSAYQLFEVRHLYTKMTMGSITIENVSFLVQDMDMTVIVQYKDYKRPIAYEQNMGEREFEMITKNIPFHKKH